MIDLHCHVLPGIDDGPATMDGSVALARAALAAGIETLVATPHVSARYDNDAGTIARLVAELNGRLVQEQVGVEIVAGAEIALTRVAELDAGRLTGLGLGGSRWLLMEPPFTPIAAGLEGILLDVLDRGHRIVLAHPERCPAFHRDRELLARLVGSGMLLSLTAGSFGGRFGSEVRRFALELAQEGMVHNVTSDAHDCERRPPGLVAEIEQAGLAPLADWLTQAVPAAILSDGDPPPRPAVALPAQPARRSWLRRH